MCRIWAGMVGMFVGFLVGHARVGVHGIGGAFRAYDLLKWASTFSSVEEVHLWGGFPCVHLWSVRSNRRSLEGDGSNSNLFYRLLKLEMAEPLILELCHGTMGH